jgi:hypothetical protein
MEEPRKALIPFTPPSLSASPRRLDRRKAGRLHRGARRRGLARERASVRAGALT